MDKETTALTGLIFIALAALYLQKYEIATACVGAIAGYITQTEKREGTE